MITKKEFVDIVNRLKETDDFVNMVNNKARELRDAIESDFFNACGLSISHESTVVKLLEDMFNDYDTISWWLYDLDYGRDYEAGDFQDENGNEIDISTPEKLYDYLVANL